MKEEDNSKTIANNKSAYFNFLILEKLEVGIVLTASEVKSLRKNGANIKGAFVGEMGDGPDSHHLFLFNSSIVEYSDSKNFSHIPTRPRKLLLHKKEEKKFLNSIQKKGMSIVPINLYFNKRGLVKLFVGLAKGKKMEDKRDAIKERDWKIDQARILKRYNQ